MANSIGNIFRLTVFGESHGSAIGVVIEGVPAGVCINMDKLMDLMARRAPGRDPLTSPRREKDLPEFVAGIREGVATGSPIVAIIKNSDTRSSDYEDIRFTPRPGHADLTAWVKYGEARDYRGGGQFSGRLTAPICIAGAIARELLAEQGIEVTARVAEVAGESDEAVWREAIERARADGDSVGGIVECIIHGVPAGVGEPMFDGLEPALARMILGIPAVKGIEFGAGFAAGRMRGSEHNDAFCVDGGRVRTRTNHAGGILGGIADGEDIVLRAAFKPTPSIGIEQESVDLRTLESARISVRGRHDPCIALRGAVVVEAAAACVIYDELLMSMRGYTG